MKMLNVFHFLQVSGIGKVTEKMLAALGIISCSQLKQQMAMLSLLFSETTWHHFLQISLGMGSTHIERCFALTYLLYQISFLI